MTNKQGAMKRILPRFTTSFTMALLCASCSGPYITTCDNQVDTVRKTEPYTLAKGTVHINYDGWVGKAPKTGYRVWRRNVGPESVRVRGCAQDGDDYWYFEMRASAPPDAPRPVRFSKNGDGYEVATCLKRCRDGRCFGAEKRTQFGFTVIDPSAPPLRVKAFIDDLAIDRVKARATLQDGAPERTLDPNPMRISVDLRWDRQAALAELEGRDPLQDAGSE